MATDAPMAEPVTVSGKKSAGATRTAVVVVHGMGNQRPLNTTREIVDALFTSDASIEVADPNVDASKVKDKKRTWVGYDRTIGDVDLPIVTTARIKTANGNTRNIDFHEFYWAPLMSEVRFVAVPLWLFSLVKKGPATMLPGVQGLWSIVALLLAFWILCAMLTLLHGLAWFGGFMPLEPISYTDVLAGEATFATVSVWALPWGLSIALSYFLMAWRGVAVTLGFLLLTNLATFFCAVSPPYAILPMTLGSPQALIAAYIGLGVFALMNTFFLLTVAGDAARYLRAAPENVEVRRNIRALGTKMLDNLHEAKTTNQAYRYDRIIIVAHSLGTVVAYDVLRAYWSSIAKSLGDPRALAGGIDQDDAADIVDPGEWRARARTLVRELENRERKHKRWVITDFVTLGSPLAQAEFLLVGGGVCDTLDTKFEQREFPTSPARTLDKDGRLSFGWNRGHLFHAAALFGLTRWTNLYFKSKFALWGDMVGGPVGRSARTGKVLFGSTIVDVDVTGKKSRFAAHTHYWDVPKKGHAPFALQQFRQAVNLKDECRGMDDE